MEGLQVLSISFNQDYGCFACGTTNGFRVYNCDPFKETVSMHAPRHIRFLLSAPKVGYHS